MTDNLTLLGALVATHNITLDDAVVLADYFDYADEVGIAPVTIMSAIDLALNFFRPSPDEDAAETAVVEASEHDTAVCPECSGLTMDEVDIEQAIDVWGAIRGVVDKYLFDREIDQEEC